MKVKNIVLIGMPSAGKSTVGVLLAKNLGMEFLDCDLVIQKKTGKLLHEIISEKGNQGFRAIEGEILAELECENSVIATGGSAVYSQKAMEHLKKDSLTVYLSLSCDEVKKRLGDFSHRGVAMEKGQTIEDLYAERAPLYERYADIIVASDGYNINQTLDHALEAVRYCIDYN